MWMSMRSRGNRMDILKNFMYKITLFIELWSNNMIQLFSVLEKTLGCIEKTCGNLLYHISRKWIIKVIC